MSCFVCFFHLEREAGGEGALDDGDVLLRIAARRAQRRVWILVFKVFGLWWTEFEFEKRWAFGVPIMSPTHPAALPGRAAAAARPGS